MSARTTRQEARARILAAFAGQLDRLIPAEENTPLKGATFADFEDQVEALAQAALPVVLEERAATSISSGVNDWTYPSSFGLPSGVSVFSRASMSPQ